MSWRWPKKTTRAVVAVGRVLEVGCTVSTKMTVGAWSDDSVPVARLRGAVLDELQKRGWSRSAFRFSTHQRRKRAA